MREQIRVFFYALLVVGSAFQNVLAESDRLPTIVWEGSTEHPIFFTLRSQSRFATVTTEPVSNKKGYVVRAASSFNYLEVQNQKTKDWLLIKVPVFPATRQVDTRALVRTAGWATNCDQVKTAVSLTASTPKTEMYFNSQSIGSVKDDGRFYYESKAVCRESIVDLVGTLSNCKEFKDSFKAVNNPHKYEGAAVPECSKKEARKPSSKVLN